MVWKQSRFKSHGMCIKKSILEGEKNPRAKVKNFGPSKEHLICAGELEYKKYYPQYHNFESSDAVTETYFSIQDGRAVSSRCKFLH